LKNNNLSKKKFAITVTCSNFKTRLYS